MTSTGDAGQRDAGAFGELVLRRAPDGHHEVISNGTFLMDTRDGRSERALATLAIDALAPRAALHLLIGGLGVGFTLGAALASPRVAAVTVVEIEPAVVALVRERTGRRTGADLDDPRVRVVGGDLVELLQGGRLPVVDALCLDVDNGPGWTVGDGNGRLYDDDGLALLLDHVAPHGVLSVWSAQEAPSFEARLAARVAAVTTHRFPVPRGEPDVVWVAHRAPGASATRAD